MRYATPYEALEAVRRSLPPDSFPVWADELYLEYHRGTYTTHAAIKYRNRRSEAMLQTAEALASVDTAPYPRGRLEAAWRRVLFNQFHDILPGSSIDSVYTDAHATYDTAWALLDSITSQAFAGLRARMDTRGAGPVVVVFNPLGWKRSGLISVPTPGGDSETVFVRDVPPLGARVVPLADGEGSDGGWLNPPPRAGRNWMENAFLRVEIDTLTGAIVRLYDKRNRREVLAPGGRANVLLVFDDRPSQWDAWNIVLTGERWEVTDVRRTNGSAYDTAARFEIERQWGNSTFQQT
jgi:alpha-mannosidase